MLNTWGDVIKSIYKNLPAFSRTEDGRREILKEVKKYQNLSEDLRVEFSKILQKVGDQLEDGVLTLAESLTLIEKSYSDLREREKKIYEDAVYDITMKFGRGKNESRGVSISRRYESSITEDDLEFAMMDLGNIIDNMDYVESRFDVPKYFSLCLRHCIDLSDSLNYILNSNNGDYLKMLSDPRLKDCRVVFTKFADTSERVKKDLHNPYHEIGSWENHRQLQYLERDMDSVLNVLNKIV